MKNPVVVRSFSTAPAAYIAKGMLVDNGIEAEVGPDNMATLYGAGSTWAPVELYVDEADLAAAEKLLEAAED